MKPFNSKYNKIYAALFLAAHLAFISAGALHTHSYYQTAKAGKTQSDPLSSSTSECYFHFAASSFHQMDNRYCGCDRILLSGETIDGYDNPLTLFSIEHAPFSFRAPPSASC